MTDNQKRVLDYLRELREYDDSYHSTKDIGKALDIPPEELYDWNMDTGILFHLWYEQGYADRAGDNKRGFCWCAAGGRMDWSFA